MVSVPAGLHYASSFLYFSIIPKHVMTGIFKIRPAVSAIPDDRSFNLQKTIIPPTWDYVVGPIIAFGILNCHWAQTDGPITMAETLVMFVNAACSLWVGFGYYRARLYVALGALWAAPVFNIASFVLQ